MPNKIDLTGQRFGHLTVVFEEPQRSTRANWHCRCDCGKECIKEGRELTKAKRNGWISSCGCQSQLRKDIQAQFPQDSPHLNAMHEKRREERKQKRKTRRLPYK